MSSRFVILHHQLDDGEHWDLMLEHADILLTWQLSREPVSRACLPISARRIDDHRKAYLDYEGPISGSRGVVRRVDAGAVKIESLSPGRCRFVLSGGRLKGRLELASGPGQWILTTLPLESTEGRNTGSNGVS